ncbi:MAG: nitrogen fixation protein NifH, partial [Caldiserica bacterium]|nr:nitrogen fixation protein NifH [Caldisericota bacterium]
MNGWRSLLNIDPTDWLLEKGNPSSKYLTLTKLFGKDKNNPDVIQAKSEISECAPVKRIFSKQKDDGYWENSNTPYLPKYKSTYWQ